MSRNITTHTILLGAAGLAGCGAAAQTPARLFMDEHQLDSVTAEAVAHAHEQDLAVQDRHGVRFIRYWVDEENARVYCLAEASHANDVVAAHEEAHGLLPRAVHPVTEGEPAAPTGDRPLYIDVHRLGPGAVTAEAVADAHEADLEVQHRHGVNFINYWVDAASGDIFCLSEAPDDAAVLRTHEEAHGLLSDEIAEVVQGE